MYDKKFLSKVTILYVEDEEETRKESVEVFECFFKEVLVACDGYEALNIYKEAVQNQKEIDVIISDINMPNMDGIEFLEEIRSISGDIPFIFTTAFNDSPKILKAIKYKITSYMVKPINLKELILEIQEYAKQINIEDRYKLGTSNFSEYLSTIDKVAMVLKIDDNDCISYANESFLESFKYKSKEIVGKKYSSLRVEDKEQEQIRRDNTFGNIWKEKLNLKTNKGDFLYMDSITLPIHDEKNKKNQEYYMVGFLLPKQEAKEDNTQKRMYQSQKNYLTVKQIIDELKTQVSKYKHLDLLTESLDKEKEQEQITIGQIKEYAKIRQSV